MTTQEMHIEIDLELQKLNSQISKDIRPIEKDWFLNNEVLKFIKQRTNFLSNFKGLGFQETLKRVEDIKDLIKTRNCFVETNSRGEQIVKLPSDYLHYVRGDVYMHKTCTLTVSKTQTNIYSCDIDLAFPTNNTLATYTISITLANNTVVVLFDAVNLPSGYIVTTEFNKQTFMLKKALKVSLEQKIKEVLSPNSQLYWDNTNTIVLESDVAFTNVFVTRTNQTNAQDPNEVLIYSPVQKLMEYYPRISSPLRAKIRPISEEILTDVENSNLSKSQAKSPIVTIQRDCIKFSKLSGVVFGSVDITYISKPQLIDLYLNSHLNMSTNVCKEIVSNTVRFLKAIIESQNYQAYAQENILIE